MGDAASAASSDDTLGNIGEPVVSGGPLPLTVGLGTGPPYAQKYVESAIDAGYRLFDTAQEYGSEQAIGNALTKAFASGKLKREDVFVTTKVDIDNMGYEPTIESVRQSFDLLGRPRVSRRTNHVLFVFRGNDDVRDVVEAERDALEAFTAPHPRHVLGQDRRDLGHGQAETAVMRRHGGLRGSITDGWDTWVKGQRC